MDKRSRVIPRAELAFHWSPQFEVNIDVDLSEGGYYGYYRLKTLNKPVACHNSFHKNFRSGHMYSLVSS